MTKFTKGIQATAVALTALIGVAGTANAAHHEGKDIVDTAVEAGSFKTLVAAVQAAGLVDALKGEGPFTVFAPTDDAFAKLPAGTIEALLEDTDKLKSILLYHVVPGKVMAADAMKVTSADTLFGQPLPIKTGEGVMVANATVVTADIEASNGVIHVIDTVMIPKDIVGVAVSNENFTTLVAAVKAAGLVETLQGDGPFTVLAPTNAAFAKLPAGTVESLLKPENKKKLQAVLTYHVLPGELMSADVAAAKSAGTVQGQAVTIKTMDGKVMVDNANVVATDITALNGVIHVIDAVILPKE